MSLDRRSFLKSLALLAASLGIEPTRAAALLAGAVPLRRDRKRLVIVELEGGNDALATLQPLRAPALARLRPTLFEPAERLLDLDGRLGLSAALRDLMPIWQEGRLALLPQIGCRPVDRSHFRSMDVWHSAEPEREGTRDGWLGRIVAAARAEERAAPALIQLSSGPTPLLFAGEASTVLQLGDPKALELPAELLPTLERLNDPGSSVEGEARFVAEATRAALAVVRSLARRPMPEVRGNGLDAQLQIAAALAALLPEDLVLFCRLPGFDSHAAQRDSQPALLASLGRGLARLDAAFAEGDLGELAVLVFSEFGRRIAENANRGTDHGAGGLALVLGSRVKGGIKGPGLDLDHSLDGDLEPRLDFRLAYRSLAGDFLGLPTDPIGAPSAPLDLF